VAAGSGAYTDYVGGMSLSTVGNITVIADRLGNANGSFLTPGTAGNYVTAPAGNYFNTSSFSITMWVNQVTTSVTMFDFGNGGSSDNVQFILNYPVPNTYYSIYNGATERTIYSSFTFPVGAWTHLALTYNASNLTASLYVNGNLTGTGNSVPFTNLRRQLNYFGHSSYNWYSNVMFDEIKFHGRSLTQQEIRNDFVYNQSYISFL
jgi:hypothetical protein